MESQTLRADSSLFEFTFDLHLRFGSEGGIDDGVLAVQGWDGSAWLTIPPRNSWQQAAACDRPVQAVEGIRDL